MQTSLEARSREAVGLTDTVVAVVARKALYDEIHHAKRHLARREAEHDDLAIGED